MPAVKLKSLPDPLRAALVDALADLAAAKQNVERHEAATRKTWRAMREAETAIAKAEKGIEEAQAEQGHVLVDAAAADDDDPPPPSGMVRLARQSRDDAVDELAALKSARDQLRRTLPDFEADVRASEDAVEAAVSAILAPIVADLTAQLEKLIREAMPLRELLHGLSDAHADRLVSWSGRRPIEAELDAARKIVWAPSIDSINVLAAFDGPWKAARALLKQDPHAALSDLTALSASARPSEAG